MVPQRKLHPLANLRVIELWLGLEFGVQVIIDLFGLSDDLPAVILVLLNEANGIALAKRIQILQLLALDLTSQTTSCGFNHFLNLFSNTK